MPVPEDDILAAYAAGQPVSVIAARFGVDPARVESIVDLHLPPTGLQVPGTRVLVAVGLGVLTGSLFQVLGARTGFAVVLGLIAAAIALPILASLAPPRR
ncbi:helix-turn-helix domain-containing protein [Asanoa sp. WMMD1127]|uniref:helix-turn-helix domain-containing protein n=1 Tax=Asanoa sp. WMMD1127 TaxID=3016107 RepID=UPI002417386C|nr:helix-turn-helix domain-containing protein [Asanoa sp. WMMD1127]MDG4821821.1 helix-turn-helix domain-containing protein [Asanoa sp. WMMD1127]